MTLATDWDTDHSIALAPERTAWLIDTLGFKGRQNHYVGALWFYELANPDNVYAAGTVTFGGTPEPGQFVSVFLARDDDPAVRRRRRSSAGCTAATRWKRSRSRTRRS